jgi:Phytanoyl-CoA dioxygenase (PhyH)
MEEMIMKPFTFQQISEMIDESRLSPVDRKDFKSSHPDLIAWRNTGVLIMEDFIPRRLIDAYCSLWERENQDNPRGWRDCTPYMRHQEIRDLGLYSQLMHKMALLVGEPVGMHLNLTGWVSTERRFHQDTYLNPPHVTSHYIAAWIALDDIHPDSGPFQFVPGSHKWPTITREKLFQFMPESWQGRDDWPTLTQDAVAEVLESEIKTRKAYIHSFLPKKGTVLLWHSNLVHQGSNPKVPGTRRKSFISHYSGIHHRQDMPRKREVSPGCFMFEFDRDVNGNV